MPNIIHRIGVYNTTAKEVYNSVATIKGLRSWWTATIEGQSEVGGVIHFLFNGGGPEFEVIKLEPHSLIEWKCVSGAPEWIDTHVSFDINEQDDEVVVLFKHSGWREEVEFMHHCSSQWAYFLFGLRQLLSGDGPGTAYGTDHFTSISSWTK